MHAPPLVCCLTPGWMAGNRPLLAVQVGSAPVSSAGRVPLSPEASCLGMAHFFELSFGARFVELHGRPVHTHFARYFGLGQLVACFHYEEVECCDVTLPPAELACQTTLQQEWLTIEIDSLIEVSGASSAVDGASYVLLLFVRFVASLLLGSIKLVRRALAVHVDALCQLFHSGYMIRPWLAPMMMSCHWTASARVMAGCWQCWHQPYILLVCCRKPTQHSVPSIWRWPSRMSRPWQPDQRHKVSRQKAPQMPQRLCGCYMRRWQLRGRACLTWSVRSAIQSCLALQ